MNRQKVGKSKMYGWPIRPVWQIPVGIAGLVLLLLPGCALVERVGVAVLYEKTEGPAGQEMRNQAYGKDPRQVLDFFVPRGPAGWPCVVFVHGGSWVEGSKDLKVGGADVYRNIGRFLAAHGVGAAVISYRLQPEVTWREQVADVGSAAAWVRGHAGQWGGRGEELFLFGHSAGAQLVSYTGLNGAVLRAAGVRYEDLRGVMAVSGAGLDLGDLETYDLGHSVDYYRGVFNAGGGNADWQREASAVSYIRKDSPPFLILYGGVEEKAMIRQSVRLHEALNAGGVANRLLVVPGQSHGRMVLTLSRDDKLSGPAVLEFIRGRVGS